MKQLRELLLSVLFVALPAMAQQRFVGGDISVLQSYEDNNVNYYDQKGAKITNVLQYLKSEAVGWNALRVRLFVDPQQKGPGGYADAQVCQDLDYVVRLCKRIKADRSSVELLYHGHDIIPVDMVKPHFIYIHKVKGLLRHIMGYLTVKAYLGKITHPL